MVQIDGVTRVGFREVEGLSAVVDVMKYREGSDAAMASRLEPGLANYGPLILRYGVVSSKSGVNNELWNWMKQILNGDTQKRNIVIIVLDWKNNPMVTYKLTNAWPSSWKLSKLDSRSSSPLIEEIIIQYEALNVE